MMASAHEIRELVAQTTTGTRHRYLPREARNEVTWPRQVGLLEALRSRFNR
jgi:hypothetical protein